MAYRFSGHESFPFRYAWLPKAVQIIGARPNLFTSDRENEAMVELGVGKNMVRAIRFWVEAAGMAKPNEDGGLQATPLGKLLLAEGGLDPYLEDIRTLWMLHWNISTVAESPLFAWEFLLGRLQQADFTESEVLKIFRREADKVPKPPSPVTLKQHFEVFVHTYVPTRGRKGEVAEENLDCPLTELEMITRVGEREHENGRAEAVYGFRREEKSSISPELFAWAVNRFFVRKRAGNERTLPARAFAIEVGSPGQVFKLPEESVYQRLTELAETTNGRLSYQESEALPQVHRPADVPELELAHAVLKRSPRLSHV